MKRTLHPGAEQDLADAIDFYLSNAGPALASRFLDEFERVAELLATHPEIGTPATSGRRRFPLRMFRYSVVYRADQDALRILVVRHQHRQPGFGGGRANLKFPRRQPEFCCSINDL